MKEETCTSMFHVENLSPTCYRTLPTTALDMKKLTSDVCKSLKLQVSHFQLLEVSLPPHFLVTENVSHITCCLSGNGFPVNVFEVTPCVIIMISEFLFLCFVKVFFFFFAISNPVAERKVDKAKILQSINVLKTLSVPDCCWLNHSDGNVLKDIKSTCLKPFHHRLK